MMEEIKLLSPEQKQAVLYFLEGYNIFITGKAGTGKSRIIETILNLCKTCDKLKSKVINVTATTGLSAISVSGTTIHSFAGVGTGELPKEYLLKRIRGKEHLKKRWTSADILIIDEVSMLSCDLFEKLEYIARTIRKTDAVFGGIQILLFGDFFQLPPIIKDQPNKSGGDVPVSKEFCFESEMWARVIQKTVLLKTVFRQKDETYIRLLDHIRVGLKSDIILNQLKTRVIVDKNKIPQDIPILYPKLKQVRAENDAKLAEVQAPEYVSIAKYSGNPKLARELKSQMIANDREKLTFKKGARVMITANIDIGNRLVNGTLGTIKEIQADVNYNGDPTKLKIVVSIDSGNDSVVCSYINELEQLVKADPSPTTSTTTATLSTATPESVADEPKPELKPRITKISARVTQIPLILAYSLSIHKIQGQTLERAVMSLDECFSPSQIYVALSRVKSVEGLYLTSFDPDLITVKQKVRTFYKKLYNSITSIK